MRPSIQIEAVDVKYVSAAVDLVIAEYIEERSAIPFLPNEQEFLSLINKYTEVLFRKGSGVVALHEGEVVGFLAGWEISELFGNAKGAYSPLYGHGAVKKYRSDVYQELYRKAAQIWIEKSLSSHAITLFTHDKETIDTWFWLGFGLRCVDAIRQVAPVLLDNPEIRIEKIRLSDLPGLAELHREHHQYYTQSPLLMHREDEDPLQDLTDWLQTENHHLWAAFYEGNPVGYMRIQPTGESFISEHAHVMNITGAYVLEGVRKSHVGAMLLKTIQEWLIKHGYPLCGVEFESFNILGSRFWTRYFTPYTYSLTRRIDERIIK